MSDSDKPRDDAEPVDAEFEPAPDPSGAEPSGAKRARGAGPLKLTLFVAAAALIGGATGFALSRYVPAETVPGGAVSALEDRVAALEAADGPDLEPLAEQVSRLNSVVQARDALPGRLDALEAAVADLGAAAGGAERGALEAALSDVRARLAGLEDAVSVARSEAGEARSAARQANAALSEISAGSGSGDAPPDARLAALSGRIDALDQAITEVRDALRPLETLPARVETLSQARQSGEGPDPAAGADLRARLQDMAQTLSRLSERVDALEQRPAGAPEPADLAARALAFAALSEAASGAQPFAVEVEALARVWPDAPGLAMLRATAREGAPTADRLEETFPAEMLREATGEARTYFGVLRVARDENAGPAAQMAQALAEDDLALAADIAAGLDPAARDALGSWRGGLSARLGVRQALRDQSAALAAAGEQP